MEVIMTSRLYLSGTRFCNDDILLHNYICKFLNGDLKIPILIEYCNLYYSRHPNLKSNYRYSNYCHKYIWVLDIDPNDHQQKGYNEDSLMEVIDKIKRDEDVSRILVSKNIFIKGVNVS